MVANKSAARILILISLIVNLLVAALITVVGLMIASSLGAANEIVWNWNTHRQIELRFSSGLVAVLVIFVSSVFALSSVVTYKLHRALLEMVDNSHSIKDQLRDANKLLKERAS
ncbi:hypothetical protein [Roseinatronobacter monicus]|uniref:Uncharacterized protein n=1 Tax=Roseinatronobacter monicus TaxID=393481 RepID=A0A543KFC0_9RHOB|nr:hypothetical protein [Roseinatronobacter monicus]TQM93776.1 hypothetical protein BD293_2425 [Roseinatronobacter monicus]